ARNDAPRYDDCLIIGIRPLNGCDRNLAERTIANRFLDVRLVKCVTQPLHLLAEFILIDTERDINRQNNGGINRRFLGWNRSRKGEAEQSGKENGAGGRQITALAGFSQVASFSAKRLRNVSKQH